MSRVWICKIVVDDTSLPDGFDSPPRKAAIAAVEAAGVRVRHCFSGWGGKLEPLEAEVCAELDRK